MIKSTSGSSLSSLDAAERVSAPCSRPPSTAIHVKRPSWHLPTNTPPSVLVKHAPATLSNTSDLDAVSYEALERPRRLTRRASADGLSSWDVLAPGLVAAGVAAALMTMDMQAPPADAGAHTGLPDGMEQALLLAEGELELESSLHVTGFTAASCFSRFSAPAAPSVNADDEGSSAGKVERATAPPRLRSMLSRELLSFAFDSRRVPSLSAPTAYHDNHARQLTNLVTGIPTRGFHLSDPSGADGSASPGSISERQRDISFAACLATPAEPVERFERARVVTRTAAEVEVETERLGIIGVPDEVEAGLYRARRWVDTVRRLRLRQARLARKSMGGMASMSAPSSEV